MNRCLIRIALDLSLRWSDSSLSCKYRFLTVKGQWKWQWLDQVLALTTTIPKEMRYEVAGKEVKQLTYKFVNTALTLELFQTDESHYKNV